MKVNATSFNYSINNKAKQYTTKPMFKNNSASIAQIAIVDQFIESSNRAKDVATSNPLVSTMNKLSYLKEVLFSHENTKKAKDLQSVLENYDSKNNLLYLA